MTITTLRKISLSCLLAWLLINPAQAEKADRTKPINLEADSVTLDDLHKTGVYQGNVVLIQGTLMMRADKVDVTQDENGLKTVLATGNPVSFRQKRDGVDEYVEAYAPRVEFDNIGGLLELSGGARLRKGEDEIRGNVITYNTQTELYKVVGKQNAQTPAGRVHIVIHPKTQAK
ncbi:MAG TPA: lipopolysaccharide transport periplasmic protein LptA [Thiobacillaceae bacterium]|nr:lipopolysaccharide transport periplasmic protein LptA [Thiobacillaceae bacterium]